MSQSGGFAASRSSVTAGSARRNGWAARLADFNALLSGWKWWLVAAAVSVAPNARGSGLGVDPLAQAADAAIAWAGGRHSQGTRAAAFYLSVSHALLLVLACRHAQRRAGRLGGLAVLGSRLALAAALQSCALLLLPLHNLPFPWGWVPAALSPADLASAAVLVGCLAGGRKVAGRGWALQAAVVCFCSLHAVLLFVVARAAKDAEVWDAVVGASAAVCAHAALRWPLYAALGGVADEADEDGASEEDALVTQEEEEAGGGAGGPAGDVYGDKATEVASFFANSE